MRSFTVAMSAVSAPVMSRVIAWTPVMMVSALALSAFASVPSALRCPPPHKVFFNTTLEKKLFNSQSVFVYNSYSIRIRHYSIKSILIYC